MHRKGGLQQFTKEVCATMARYITFRIIFVVVFMTGHLDDFTSHNRALIL